LKAKGVTLLEVILAVAIVAALITVVAPRLGGRNNQIKAVVRKIAVISRDIKSQAKLQNSTYRLVIDIGGSEAEPPADENPFNRTDTSDKTYSFWVEKAPGSVLGDQAEAEEEAREEAARSGDTAEAAHANNEFAPDTRIMKKPEVLPSGMKFDLVELASRKDPITEGRVYIYYLPQGYVEESAIQISYGDALKWTIAIRPLTGRADIYQEHLLLKDVRSE
jgi:general secretion pathway protein H